MIAFKLAIKNLIGAGLRTWLNVFVLSLSYVIIIWYSGIIEGWNRQARRDTINWQVGGGQYWQENYDPYDPFTLTESHAHIPTEFRSLIKEGEMTPLLLSQGTIYPEGRMQSVLIKGIDPAQDILKIPSHLLKGGENVIPALIGKRMASSTHMKKGDFVTLRWRDVNGTFDAGDAEIMDIFDSTVPMVDNGQIWVPLQRLQEMTQMKDQATLLVTA
ncbi:MAG: ABC transporter permease, partial [bacterium]